MAIALEDKPNVTGPGGNYPFGDIRDNPGDNTGTPVNREVYADFHQFFAKILDAAGIVANGLLENQAAGFQYFDALIANIRQTAASEALAGTVERADQTEVNDGVDTTRYISPATLANSDYFDYSLSEEVYTDAGAGTFTGDRKVLRTVAGACQFDSTSFETPNIIIGDLLIGNIGDPAFRPVTTTIIPIVAPLDLSNTRLAIIETNGDISIRVPSQNVVYDLSAISFVNG